MNIFGIGKKEEEVKDTTIEETKESPIEEVKEETPAEVGAQLQTEADKFEIPESFEGKAILSTSGFKEVGGVTYAKVYCDDHCTYDVPLTPKSK